MKSRWVVSVLAVVSLSLVIYAQKTPQIKGDEEETGPYGTCTELAYTASYGLQERFHYRCLGRESGSRDGISTRRTPRSRKNLSLPAMSRPKEPRPPQQVPDGSICSAFSMRMESSSSHGNSTTTSLSGRIAS